MNIERIENREIKKESEKRQEGCKGRKLERHRRKITIGEKYEAEKRKKRSNISNIQKIIACTVI